MNRERAKILGIPLDSILTPFADPYQDANLDDLNDRAAIERLAALPEVKFIVIDSLSGSTRQKENDTGIKDVTGWAAKLYRDISKPNVMTHHLSKRKEWETEEISLDRVRGSSAITQFARVIMALSCPDPTDKETKRLEQIKNNHHRFPDPIGMTTGEDGITFGLAPTAPHVDTPSEIAADLLLTLLKSGPVEANKVFDEAKIAGCSPATVNRVKASLGIVSINKSGSHFWSLPVKHV